MKYIRVDNIDAQELQVYKNLRDNLFDADNSFVADSPKVVNTLLQTNLEVYSILATQEYYDESIGMLQEKKSIKFYLATKEQMQTIVGHKVHHNCMMHGVRPKLTDIDALGENILMLDAITSSENIGSIARSAAALGINSYLLPLNAPHPYGRRALRVSMGHISKLQVSIYEDIEKTIVHLQKNGYKVYAAEVTQDSISLARVKLSHKWVLLMGHEGLGLSENILKLCDEVVSIEMVEGVRSLNVAVASAIMMYKFKN